MNSPFTLREKRFVRGCILITSVLTFLLAFRSEERIYTRPYLEDSFYLFNCAEHFAHGEGFTTDGIHPTNGVQPLVVVLYAPLFVIAGANKLLALRLVFLLIALFNSFSILFIARLVRILQKRSNVKRGLLSSPPMIAAFLWATLYPIFVHTGSGLETGLYSLMLLISLYYYAKLSKIRSIGNTVRGLQWFGLGLILGLTVLARVDAVFLVIAISCYEFYRFRASGFISAAILSIVAFFVSSPWWYYNYKIFGNIMPQSGVSESLDSSMTIDNIRRGLIVISDIFTVFFFLPYYFLPNWFDFVWPVIIPLLMIWLIRKIGLRSFLKETTETASLLPLALFSVVLVIYYIFFFGAPHFIPRYFQPLRLLWLILFVLAAPKLIDTFKAIRANRKKVASIIAILFALGAVGFSGSRFAYYFMISRSSEFYRTGLWALSHPNERIGMEQSGTAGFVAPNVVNLDGKVNFEALKAQQKGDIGNYIAKEAFDYIADWREFSTRLTQSALTHDSKYLEVDSISSIIIWKRVK